MRISILIIFIFSAINIFSQYDYLKKKQLFLGADSIEGKKIIAGIYLVAIDSFIIKMNLDVLDDWKQKDSITEYLTLDKLSMKQNLFFIIRKSDSLAAYRYFNANGFEIYLQKERCHESYNAYGTKNPTYCSINLAQVYLPPKKKFYVSLLPLMFNK